VNSTAHQINGEYVCPTTRFCHRDTHSIAGDCHGIRKHRVLSPSHLGLAAGVMGAI
jgi:hypothetical protein